MSIARRLGHSLICAAILLLAAIAALGAALGAAGLIASPPLIALAGLVAPTLVALGGTALATRSLPTHRRCGLTLTNGALAAALALAITAILARPLGDAYTPPEPVAGQAFWDLPTGSHLAYVRVAAVGSARPEPIVYLHGGPGVSELPEATAAFGQLAAAGYDVYLYNQLGVGRSARLADPTGYAMARDLADLEASRARLGADRLILIGHSWGATLAAAYLAAYPERVARVVFSSPGALALGEYGTAGTGIVARLPPARRDAANALLYQPRATAAWALTRINPRAAHAFAGDRELDARFDRITSAATPGLFCDVATPPLTVTGTGFYASQVTLADPAPPDPRAALRAVAVPALVLKAGGDYLPWRFAIAYRDTIPGAALVYLPDAGHQAYLEQPVAYFAAVRAFLHDQSLPAAPCTGDNPPPDYRGAR